MTDTVHSRNVEHQDTAHPATKALARKLTPGEWIMRIVLGAVIASFVVFFLLPIVWLLLAGTKDARSLLLENPMSFGSFEQLAANWEQLFSFQNGIFLTWIGNSALYSFGALVITLIVSVPAGYALALGNFPGRKALLLVTLIVMLIPNTALVLPIFLELSAVKLIGSPLAVILPFSFFPFGVYLTYIYFSTAVSRDLLDAARIDGASELRVFAQVAMPLATPSSPWSGSSASRATGTTTSCRSSWSAARTCPCRSASPTCSRTCPSSTPRRPRASSSSCRRWRSRRCSRLPRSSSSSCSRSGSSSPG